MIVHVASPGVSTTESKAVSVRIRSDVLTTRCAKVTFSNDALGTTLAPFFSATTMSSIARPVTGASTRRAMDSSDVPETVTVPVISVHEASSAGRAIAVAPTSSAASTAVGFSARRRTRAETS